jgi:hypothetical protein
MVKDIALELDRGSAATATLAILITQTGAQDECKRFLNPRFTFNCFVSDVSVNCDFSNSFRDTKNRI